MINRINNQANQLLPMLDELRKANRPIALYGGGEVANKVIGILRTNNLMADAVWVDKPDNPPHNIFHGKTVEAIENIENINEFSIIICIGNYKDAKSKLNYIYRAEHVYMIDNIYSYPPISHTYISKNSDAFLSFYDSLADARSKEIMVAFLNARVSGNPEYLFDYYDPCQYFPLDIPGFPNFSCREVFVDCGAFVGDTVIDFLKITNHKYRKIFALEPDKHNYQLLLSTIQTENIKNIIPIRKGASSSPKTVRFESQGIVAHETISGTTAIDVDCIDALVGNDAISFIKMDIEGSELEALRGGGGKIRTHKPKLAISVYHKPDDLITIPQYIQTLVPNYHFYLRSHKCMSIDLVLYAIPRS